MSVRTTPDPGLRLITSTNRLAWFFLLRKARRAGWDWVVYAVKRDHTAENDDLQETS